MRFTFQQRAGEHEKFAEDAFDSQIGKIIPLNLRQTDDGPVIGTMGGLKVMRVSILDEGRVAEFEMEMLEADKAVAEVIADSVIKHVGGAVPHMSFAFKEKS